jgi:hypothetical protein
MAGWPDVNEFTDFLIASGLYGITPTALQGYLDIQGALDAAVEEWNDTTKYWPFLSNGNVNEERRFQPPALTPLLDLNSGLITCTSVTVDSTFANPTGNVRTELLDYWLKPDTARQRGIPWTYLLIRKLWFSNAPQSLIVKGEWGYCDAAHLPSSARRAVMALAAQDLLPQIQTGLSHGGLIKLTEGDSSKEWGFRELNQLWQGIVDKALRQGYVRQIVG